jgi:hypothetical protein
MFTDYIFISAAAVIDASLHTCLLLCQFVAGLSSSSSTATEQ